MKKTDRTAWEDDRPGKRDGTLEDDGSRSVFWTGGPWAWLAFARRPGLLPEVALAARPGVLLLTTGLLAGLCLILTCWGSGGGKTHRAQPAGLGLLADNSSPKLDNTSATAPASPSAPAPKEEPDRRAPATAPAAPAPLPPLDPTPPVEVPRVEPAPVAPAAVELPAENSYAFRDAYRGETPMLSTWKTLGLQTLLAAAFVTPAAAPAADPPAEPDKTTATINKHMADLRAELNTKLDQLDRSIRKGFSDVREDLDRTEGKVKAAQLGLETMRTEVEQLRQQLADLRAKLPPTTVQSAYPPEAKSDMEQLHRALDQIRIDLDTLLRREPPATRISGFAPATATGQVRLVNTFPQPMTVVVNGRSYELNPGETRFTAPIPYGPFTYEVLGVTPPRTRTLAPSATPFTVEVYPQ